MFNRLSTRTKIAGIITLSIAALLLATFLISNALILEGFIKLEDGVVTSGIRRTETLIQEKLRSLDSKLSNWSSRDDTYNFLEDKNDAYITSNLVAQALINLKLNFIVFVDSKGDIFQASSYDFRNNKIISIPESLKKYFNKDSLFLKYAKENRPLSGIIKTPEGILLFASRPILTSRGEGPPRGVLIFSYYLDNYEINQMGEIIRFPISVYSIDQNYLIGQPKVVKEYILSDKELLIFPVNKETTLGYGILKDIFGNKAYIFRVDIPRDIYRQGQAVVNYFLFLMIVISFLIGFVIFFVLDYEIAMRAKAEQDLRNLNSQLGLMVKERTKQLEDSNLELTFEVAERKKAEKELLEKESKFRAIFDQTYQFIGIMTTDGILIDANRTALKFSGVSEEDVLGKPFWEGPWWKHSKQMQDKLRDAINRAALGEFVRFEATHPASDGSIHYVDFSLKPVTDATGKVALLIPEGRDITERKKVEESLSISQEKFSKAFLASADMLLISSLETGRFIEVNDTTSKVLGYSRDEMIGRTSLELNIWLNNQDRIRLINKLKEGSSVREFEVKQRRKSGEEFFASISAERIEIAGEQCLLATVRDITQRKRTEESLAKISLQHKALLDNMPDISWLKDLEGKFIAVNSACAKSCGFNQPEDLVGRTDFDIWPKDMALKYVADDKEVMLTHERKRIEEELIGPDGQKKFIETVKTPFFDENGQVAGTAGIARDITERKKTEEALRDYSAELAIRVKIRTAELSKANEDLYNEVRQRRTAEQRLSELNECFLKFGVDPLLNINALTKLSGELLGADCAFYHRIYNGMLNAWGQWNSPENFTCNDDPKKHICYDVITAVKDETVLIRDLQKTKYADSDPNVRKCGLQTYVGRAVGFFGSLCVLYKKDYSLSEEDKKIISIIVSAIDIEEKRKDALEAIRESQERFKKITETVTDYIFNVTVENGRAISTFHGPGCLGVAGYTSQEFESNPLLWISIVPEEDREVVIKHAEDVLLGKNLKPIEHRLIKKDGSMRWVRNTPVPHYDSNGNMASYDGLIRDITERKHAEQLLIESMKHAEEASIMKGRFLANMSHEIRTPMNAIIGFSELLENTSLDYVQKDYINVIHESGQMLMALINDILDVSKIEAGELQLERIDFDLSHLIRSVIKMNIPRIEGKDIEVFCNIEEDVPKWVKGDPTRIRQILMNLLSNATKFTEKGEISISVGLDSKEIDKTGKLKTLKFSVRDTGIGIPKQKQGRLFQAFEQADISTTRKYGGTGLGLSISKALVEIMGGKMWLESEPDKGSVFYFTLKLQESDSAFIKEILPLSLVGIKGKRVVVVDDNIVAQRLIGSYCKEFGLKILHKSLSAKDALDWLLSHPDKLPDIVLTDIMMPGMDGYELAVKIRSDKNIKAVKLIAITADVRPGAARKTQESGFDAYLTKPVVKPDLLKVIQTTLGDRREKDGYDNQIITSHMAEELACKGIMVLVVEDNLVNQKLIQAVLKNLGCEVELASNGQVAVEKMKVNKYDLVLMDLQMPIMGGCEATEIIRKDIDKSTPIVALTAAAMREDEEKSLAAGMNDYITKPVDLNKLREKVFRWGRCKL